MWAWYFDMYVLRGMGHNIDCLSFADTPFLSNGKYACALKDG